MYSIEEYDVEKTKVLKYVLYKKRTEQEIRLKFAGQIEENMLEDIIEELKENEYIDDTQYVEKAVREYIALKKISKKELRYKLYAKGLADSIIEDYFSAHKEELEEYEINSAKDLIRKKGKEKEIQELIEILLRKGYEQETIKQVIDE